MNVFISQSGLFQKVCFGKLFPKLKPNEFDLFLFEIALLKVMLSITSTFLLTEINVLEADFMTVFLVSIMFRIVENAQ